MQSGNTRYNTGQYIYLPQPDGLRSDITRQCAISVDLGTEDDFPSSPIISSRSLSWIPRLRSDKCSLAYVGRTHFSEACNYNVDQSSSSQTNAALRSTISLSRPMQSEDSSCKPAGNSMSAIGNERRPGTAEPVMDEKYEVSPIRYHMHRAPAPRR